MPVVTYVSSDEEKVVIEVANGSSVMEGAVSNGVEGIVAECGGSATCATCHVYVDSAFLSLVQPISEIEDEMLEMTASPRRPESRLGCQIVITDALNGLIVRLPDSQL